MDNNNIVINHLIKISEDIGSINSKLDNISYTLTKHLDEDVQLHDEQGKQIQRLEDSHKRIKWVVGGATMIILGVWKVVEAFILGGWNTHH
ncbi:MAG: hypothetical protein ACREQ5_07295 [Candidatus Dormibacteria bacterium]